MIIIGHSIRIIIGAILLVAGASKILDFRWFVDSLGNYELAPKILVRETAISVVLAEGIIGSMLISGIASRFAGYAALALLLTFIFAIVINFLRGRLDVNCGCFGFWKKTKLGWQLLLRNVGLTGLVCLSLPIATSFAPVPFGSILVVSVLSILLPFFI